MILEINNAWNWKGMTAIEIIHTNDFGNVIFKTDKNDFWRICPEEISCEKIAETKQEFDNIIADPDFIADWEMINMVNMAKAELGELEKHEKFCLKMPTVLGGSYEISNIGKISFLELIAFSGDLGRQTNDLKDGQKIVLKVNS